MLLCCRSLLKGHLEEQPDDGSSILLLKENVRHKFDFLFPRDDLVLTAVLLDFEIFKNEMDERLNLLDG